MLIFAVIEVLLPGCSQHRMNYDSAFNDSIVNPYISLIKKKIIFIQHPEQYYR
jgi:hypothetical protein